MTRTPYYQSNFGAAVASGLVIVLSTLVLNVLVKDLKPWQLLVLVGGLAVLVAVATSLIMRTWRQKTWISFGKWASGLGFLTNRRRSAIFKSGYAKRNDEVAAERRRSLAPSWHVDVKSHFNDEGRLFWLNNRGHVVTDVRLAVDAEYFQLDADAFWPGPWGGGTGKFFEGVPTVNGRTTGIPFLISWVDQNGDAKSTEEPVVLRPEQLQAPAETADEAYQRGRADAIAEQAETVPKRLIRPAWQVGNSKVGGSSAYLLANHATGSFASQVILDTPPQFFTFMSARELGDLAGGEVGPFQGRLTETGHVLGVTFAVRWTDAKGDDQVDDVILPERRGGF